MNLWLFRQDDSVECIININKLLYFLLSSHLSSFPEHPEKAPAGGEVLRPPSESRGRGIKKGPAAPLLQDPKDGDYLLSHLRSTIGVTKLNFSVRNGKRWNLRAIVTWISFYVFMTHKQAIPAPVSKLKVYTIHPLKESGRAISNARLWCLHLYTCILSTSSSLTTLRNLILWPASYLDAFSTYPIPT